MFNMQSANKQLTVYNTQESAPVRSNQNTLSSIKK